LQAVPGIAAGNAIAGTAQALVNARNDLKLLSFFAVRRFGTTLVKTTMPAEASRHDPRSNDGPQSNAAVLGGALAHLEGRHFFLRQVREPASGELSE
jgi:hypothetical protein